MKFGPPYAPYSNRKNERNHGSCDKIIEKILEDNPRMPLQTAVDRAAWTHNSNANKDGFTPFQLMIGRNPSLPGINMKVPEQSTIEFFRGRLECQRIFSEAEFKRKIRVAEESRTEEYAHDWLEEGAEVLYQAKDGKDWFGPVKVL